MSSYVNSDEVGDWMCADCGSELELGKIEVRYMGSGYPVDLPRCPKCGQVFIPEKLATVKMAEIEKLLEDK
ncbi:MAG: DVU_1557 family redox protein [Desulfomonilaceae bacterium]